MIKEVEQAEPEEDVGFVNTFVKKHTRFVDGRIEVGVPVLGHHRLQSNKNKCLALLRRQFPGWEKRKQIEIIQQIVDDWLLRGIIEEASPDNEGYTLSFVSSCDEAYINHYQIPVGP